MTMLCFLLLSTFTGFFIFLFLLFCITFTSCVGQFRGLPLPLHIAYGNSNLDLEANDEVIQELPPVPLPVVEMKDEKDALDVNWDEDCKRISIPPTYSATVGYQGQDVSESKL